MTNKKVGAATYCYTAVITDKQYKFLKDKCINKSNLLAKLIDIRMTEPVMVIE